ncbi:MAG: hypothetical protein FD119_3736 [Stygiobacter sp.]|nr:MAG: hypothetical protein FD119_3736 [Stygiobacter sp.]
MSTTAKLLALAGSDNDAEAIAALRKVKALLAENGKDFTDLAQLYERDLPKPAYQQSSPNVQSGRPPFTDIMAGFDDCIEEKEPGYKARESAERTEKIRKEAEEREKLIAKYGSLEAVLEPCEKELVLREALKPWIIMQGERWTSSVDGLHSPFPQDISPEVRKALEGALPLPTTITEAMPELLYWEQRDREMELALDCIGNGGLDFVCQLRFNLIQDMVEETLPVQDIQELATRFRRFYERGFTDDDLLESMLIDVERLAASPIQTGHHGPGIQNGHTATKRREQVIAMLSDSETALWSDRKIARAAGVSPTTVGTIRKQFQ